MASKRCKTENSQKLENFVAANTIMARVSMILWANIEILKIPKKLLIVLDLPKRGSKSFPYGLKNSRKPLAKSGGFFCEGLLKLYY